jgi:hypothetical protein
VLRELVPQRRQLEIDRSPLGEGGAYLGRGPTVSQQIVAVALEAQSLSLELVRSRVPLGQLCLVERLGVVLAGPPVRLRSSRCHLPFGPLPFDLAWVQT